MFDIEPIALQFFNFYTGRSRFCVIIILLFLNSFSNKSEVIYIEKVFTALMFCSASVEKLWLIVRIRRIKV